MKTTAKITAMLLVFGLWGGIANATVVTLEFEDLTLGESYSVGDSFTTSGVVITVEQFQIPEGNWDTYGAVTVRTDTGLGFNTAGGSGNELGVSSVNLYFDFDTTLIGLELLYGDFGGNLNIELNGDFVNFGNFIDIDNTTIGGTSISTFDNGTPGQSTGTLSVVGTIQSFRVGGAELWIDNVVVIPYQPKTYYVNAAEGSDNNDGLSPQTPFATIQKAIDSAYNGDTVLVADGTYTGDGNRDIDFLGKAITVRSESGPENCIIDCNGTKDAPHRGFYFHSREDENSILDGFTITNGFAEKGGGIQCINSSPTITNCTFRRNSAIFISGSNVGGGGMYNQNGSPRLVNCIFTDNTNTTSDGAGMYSTGGRPTLTDCAFTYNLITGNSSGAGMCNKRSNAILKDCTFIGNEAHGVNWGGGMVNWESKPTLTNCAFIENWAEDDAGALANFTSEPTLTNCTFIRNRAETNAGAVLNINKSYAILTNCTFTGNSAGSRGGAVYNPRWHIGDESDITLINCEIVANRAERGGGIFNSGGNSTLVNCTLIANRATYNGGALFGDSCIVDIINCTFASNRAQNGTAVACDSSGHYEPTDLQITSCILWDGGNEIWNNDTSTINIAYSDVYDGWPGASNIDADPCFVESGFWDINGLWVDGDYHLCESSPCINAGDPVGDYNEQTDIDGEPRVMAGRVDMGADESPYELGTLVDLQIMGPDKVGEYSSAQYTATAYYEGGHTADVTVLAVWSLAPQICGTIDESGFLHTERIETAEYITIYAQYSERDVTTDAEMAVQVALPIDLEIAGPEQVRETCQGQYKAVVYYDDGQTRDVTDSTLWLVDPQVLATIEAGLLQAGDINEPQNITVYAAYTTSGATVEVEIMVQITLSQTLYVPTDYQTIQEAINAAECSDTVLVANGNYTGPGNRYIDFLGKAITVCSENGPNNCTIDCENSGFGFLFRNGEREDSVVDGFTITNGFAEKGGGIQCINSSPTITNCTITDNTASRGGGIYCGGWDDYDWQGGSPTITNCTIKGNSSGIYCRDSNPTITNCTISENGIGYGPGGGIFCEASSPTITNCTISGNGPWRRPPSAGGGIYCDGREVGSSPTITNCTITGNWGGITCGHNSSPIIKNCTISVNRDEGIFCRDDSNPTITNCIITGNLAEYGRGDGITCSYSYLTITNCTIAKNQGRGVCSGEGATITNCILWDNTDSEIYGSPIVTYSDIKGGFPGEGNIDADPHFALTTDYHLMPPSPCIDAGTNTPAGGLPAADKDGVPRPLDGDGDANAVADMGAYEYSLHSPTIAVSSRSFYFIQDWPKPEPQTLQIRNCGGQPLHWEIVEDCNWLEVIPISGVSTGQINEVTITVDPNGRAPGLYSCTFNVQDQNASNSPVTIQATMPVGTVLRVPSPNYPTIQDAIDAAKDYDIVLVANDTYTGQGNRDIDFLGKAITVRSESGPENCIIDCENSGRGFYFHNFEYANSVITGFTITNGHTARQGGGIYCERYSRPTITNCTISGNRAEDGGGIACHHGSPTIKNCIISGNNGGGIYCSYSNPKITNCTITGNSFEGIYCSRDSSLIINNSILWANTPFQIREDGASINVRYTDVQGGWEGESNMDEDPCFVEPGYLDDNGTPEDIWDDFWIDGDYYLLPDSFCIDAGDPNYMPEPGETDIDGNPRVINGRIDMGAYETNYIQAAMKLTPQMLNCNSKGKYIKAHITLPEGFLPQDVDVNAPAVAEPMGIESKYIKVIGNNDGPVRLEICFDREAFCAQITETGEVEITVIGSLTTSRYFYTNDTIKIKPRR